jgi:dihydroorotate dehydrogenase electron transfer subunit
LRRPFSLAARRDAKDGKVELDIIYRAIGRGTSYLAALAPGGRLSVLGPLGNSFAILADKPLAVLVGGGVGIGPLLYLAEALAAANKRTFAFCGARSARLLPLKLTDGSRIPKQPVPTLCAVQLAAYGIPVAVATDDRSVGCAGLVSEVFQDWLEAGAEDASKLVVYCCGPQAMMRAVAKRCVSQNIKCQLAMERLMACGMGTCQSCIVKVRDAGYGRWSYKLCCTDGPIFEADELLWD